MANATSVQTLMDGQRNVVVKFEGILDTSDLSATTFIDPALLSDIDGNGTKATRLRIDRITHNIEDALSVRLWWDATTPVRIEELTGRGKQDFISTGGLKSNAGTYATNGTFTGSTGHNGKIAISTQGWAASGILSFSVVLHCVKQ